MKLPGFVVLLFVVGLLLSASKYPKPNIREERRPVVNGVAETWRLEWTKPPPPACQFGDSTATTCPCLGFAYGEAGEMDVVRLRGCSEVERLNLRGFFGYEVTVQRSAPVGNDPKHPVTEVMHFANYDHGGDKTEFYLQTEALPCGKNYGIVIGVSRLNSRLHAFGTAAEPDKPLHLHKGQWAALSKATDPVEFLDWICGDHGAEDESTVLLRATPVGILASRRTYACSRGKKTGKLLSEKPL